MNSVVYSLLLFKYWTNCKNKYLNINLNMRKHSQSNNVMRFLQFLCMRYLPIISWLILTWSLGLAMGLDSNVRNFLQYHTTTFSSMVNFFKPFKGCTYMILYHFYISKTLRLMMTHCSVWMGSDKTHKEAPWKPG